MAMFCSKCGKKFEFLEAGFEGMCKSCYDKKLEQEGVNKKEEKVEVTENTIKEISEHSNKSPNCGYLTKSSNNILMFIVGIIIVIVGIAMLSHNVNVPLDTFSFSSIKEYVGGDAYNAMIEASIRGGKISGAMAESAIYKVAGIITVCLGAITIAKSFEKK